MDGALRQLVAISVVIGLAAPRWFGLARLCAPAGLDQISELAPERGTFFIALAFELLNAADAHLTLVRDRDVPVVVRIEKDRRTGLAPAIHEDTEQTGQAACPGAVILEHRLREASVRRSVPLVEQQPRGWNVDANGFRTA